MDVFSIIVILLSIAISILICIYAIKQIKYTGFCCCATFLMVLVLFYIVIPILYLSFEENRDLSTAFNKLLATRTVEEISFMMFLTSVLIMLILCFYLMERRDGKIMIRVKFSHNQNNNNNWNNTHEKCRKIITIVADLTLLLGGISIIACIFAVGGIGAYLALGSQARGISKSITDYISSSFLPLITLSNIILASPFLYKYLLNSFKRNHAIKIKFWISFGVSVIYLLYNQGRLPLLLFFIPFIMDLKITKKAKIGSMIVVAVISVFVLEPLTDFFTYLTYGNIQASQSRGFLDTLLLEFTYPFSNFINRGELLDYVGLRYGLDYIQWPLTILPSSFLRISGFSKSSLATIGSLNTEAYGSIAGSVGGGIPTDFFTFNYYQFGIISLLLALPIVAWALRKIDLRINLIGENDSTKILILRVCFLLISMVNNFDFSVIFRMRFDFFIIMWAIFYISRKRVETLDKSKEKSVLYNF